MTSIASPRFLRTALLADAASVLPTGLLQVALTAWLARWTGLPESLLLASGLFLLGYGVFLIWISTRRPIPGALVHLVIAGNVLWGIACAALIGTGIWALTTWGVAYLVLNIVAVAVFAMLQWVGLQVNFKTSMPATG